MTDTSMETRGIRRDHELHGRRRGRNLGVLVALLSLVVMLFVVTLVKMGDQSGATVGNPSAAQAGGWTAEAFRAPLQSDEESGQ